MIRKVKHDFVPEPDRQTRLFRRDALWLPPPAASHAGATSASAQLRVRNHHWRRAPHHPEQGKTCDVKSSLEAYVC
jgi:hypothetical protein